MNNKRNYPLLLISQFFSALGDNMILAIILGPLLLEVKLNRMNLHEQAVQNIVYTSLLFIPYVIFAPLAGYLNDRFPKTTWLKGGNLIKIAGTLLVFWGAHDRSHLMGVGYFLVGLGACVYSPAKYGILPEILPTSRLVKANGLVELLTLVAILLGNIAGARLIDRHTLGTCYASVLGVYVVSLLFNLVMAPTPSYPQVFFKDSSREFLSNMKGLLSQARLLRVLVGTSLFWVCGALMKMNFQPWGQQVLHFTNMLSVALLGLWLSLGVMVGSLLAGQWYKVGDLHATRGYGWFLAGAITILGLVGWFSHHGLSQPHYFSIGVLIVAGVMAGLFLIPLNAALQAESHQDKLGKTIATQNGIENAGMLGGSLFALLNVNLGFDPSQLFLALAALVFVVCAWLRFPRPHSPFAAQPVAHSNPSA